MTEPMTMSEATTSTSGNPSSPMSGSAAATADALYGNSQQAPSAQKQAAAETAKPADSQGNPSDATKATSDAGKPAQEQAKAAPEKYEFKAPEGREVDPEVIKSFSEVARELNMTQEAAQALLDKMAPRMAERQAAQLDAIRAQWADQSRGDKEFGGDKIADNLAVAKKALDSFGTPELRTLLNESGLGNHPEIIRFMFRAGQSISVDRYVGPSAGSTAGRGAPKDFNAAAAALYSTQPQL